MRCVEVRMDINQVAKMIEWLDEERRRDKTIIAKLEEQLTQQEETVGGMTRRLNGIESDQSATRANIFASIRDGEMADYIRGTIQTIVDEVETKRLNAERENQRRADAAPDSLSKTLLELQRESLILRKLPTRWKQPVSSEIALLRPWEPC